MYDGYAIDVSALPLFLGAVVLISIAPGPDMVYILGAGVAGGRSAAIRAALGVSIGVSVWAVTVAAGLGAVVAGHPAVLGGLQIFGAGYLGWLAYSTWRDAPAAELPATEAGGDNWFRRGMIVNLTNPKVMLFFLAFLPQFIGRATSPTLQLLLLGLVFQLVGLIVDVAVGWSAGTVRDRVRTRPGIVRTMTYTSAAVFLVLAVGVGVEAMGTVSHAP